MVLLNQFDAVDRLEEKENSPQEVFDLVGLLYPKSSRGIALVQEFSERNRQFINPWVVMALCDYDRKDLHGNVSYGIEAYHGCPPVAALRIVQSYYKGEGMRNSRNPRRNRAPDKVKDDEVYAGKLHIALAYCKAQELLGKTSVITMLAIRCESYRKQTNLKGDKQEARIILARGAYPVAVMFRKDEGDGAFGLSPKYRYMSDWVEPEWWNDDLHHEEARNAEKERKSMVFSLQPVAQRAEDPELVQNTAFAASIPEARSTSFLRLRGDMEQKVLAGALGTADQFIQRVPTDSYWPSEESDGSTFRFSAWEAVRDDFWRKGIILEPAGSRNYWEESIRLTEADTSMRPRTPHAIVAARSRDPRVDEGLRRDLQQLAREGPPEEGSLLAQDKWKQHRDEHLPQLLWALRRGSSAMHVQACSIVLTRFKEEHRRLEKDFSNASRKAIMQTQMEAMQETLTKGTQIAESVDPEVGAVIKGFVNLQLVPKIMSLQSLINGMEDHGPAMDLMQLQAHSDRSAESIVACRARIIHCRGVGPELRRPCEQRRTCKSHPRLEGSPERECQDKLRSLQSRHAVSGEHRANRVRKDVAQNPRPSRRPRCRFGD